jgi:hypothetical protein
MTANEKMSVCDGRKWNGGSRPGSGRQGGSVALVGSWISMISSFVFMAFSILSTSEVPYYLMMASILLWIGCGVAYLLRESAEVV